jgi:predicted flavoprotein YhiN
MATQRGLEGGVVYALTAEIRTALSQGEAAQLTIDLRPDQTVQALAAKLDRPRGSQSLSTFLAKAAHLPPVAIALIREAAGKTLPDKPAALAALIKAVKLEVTGLAGLERAISTAGGVDWSEIDDQFMLKRLPGVFVAGEMIDWEAPTGGYLLQACFATGVAAAQGAVTFVRGSAPMAIASS